MKIKKYSYRAAVSLLILMTVFIFKNVNPAQIPREKDNGATIHGRVVSEYGPVENARVRVKGEETYTLKENFADFFVFD